MIKNAVLCAIILLSLLLPAMAQEGKTTKRALTPEELRTLLPRQLPEGPLTFPQPTAPPAPATNQNTRGTWNNGTMNQNYETPYYNSNQYNQNRATTMPQYCPQLNDRYRQTAPSTDYTRNPYLNGPYINGPIIQGPLFNGAYNTNSNSGNYPNYGDYRPGNSNNGNYPNYGDYRYRGNPYDR